MFEELFRTKTQTIDELLKEAESWNDPQINELLLKRKWARNPLVRQEVLDQISREVRRLNGYVKRISIGGEK